MIGKIALALSVVIGIFAAVPASADCASAMKANDEMMMKSTDASKKEMAMKEESMAKDMMDKKDEAGCMVHADKAMEMMK